MTASRRPHDDEQDTQAPGQAAPLPPLPVEPHGRDPQALLALQQALGNRAVGALLRPGGARLPAETQARLEAQLGEDFSEVEVQADAGAAEAARSLGARAFTDGRSVAFAAGEFAPGTEAGDALLAHELAHVAQARQAGGPPAPGRLNPAGHPSEQQAQAAGRGEPTALNAAPLGLALAPAAPEAQAQAPMWQPLTPLPREDPDVKLEDEPTPLASPEQQAQEEIAQNVLLTDTRAREYVTALENDVFDAGETFARRAEAQLDALPDAPEMAAFQGLLVSLADTLLAVGKEMLPAGRLQRWSKIGADHSPYYTMAAIFVKEGATDHYGWNKGAARGAAGKFLRASAQLHAAEFARLRAGIRPELLELASGSPDARALLTTGHQPDLETLVTSRSFLGIPQPDAAGLFQKVLTQLATDFDLWLAERSRNLDHSHLAGFRLSHGTIHQTKAAASGWAAGEAAERQARLGDTHDRPMGEFSGFGANLVIGQRPDDPELEQDPQIEYQNMAIVDTRVQAFLGAHHNALQDAVRDFVSSAVEQIGNMPDGALPGDWTAVAPWLDVTLSAISTLYPGTAVGVALVSYFKTAIETHYSVSGARSAERLREQVKGAMFELASTVSNRTVAAFSLARQTAYLRLNTLRGLSPEVKQLLQAGTPEAVERLITTYLEVPSPDSMPIYRTVRLELETRFAEQRYEALIRAERRPGLKDLPMDPNAMERVRQHAAGRVEAAVEERQAAETPLEVGAGPLLAPDPEEMDIRHVWAKYSEDYREFLLPEKRAEMVSQEEQARRAAQVQQNALLVDTRARVFQNTHYNEFQQALADFSASAASRIGAIDHQLLDYFAISGPIISVVKGKVQDFFPADALLKRTIVDSGGNLTSLGYSALTDVAKQSAPEQRAAAQAMVAGLTRKLANRFASIFQTRMRLLGPQIAAMVKGNSEVLELLTTGGLTNIDRVITTYLGIPNPEEVSIYETLREELEVTFAGWLVHQGRPERKHIGAAAAAEEDARAQVKADVAKRKPKDPA